ncbi:MAG: AAA family ATPase [Burkholderiaceae bacterium]
MQPVVIELLGGESTGKSTLAANLRDTAQAHHIPHRLVSEYLREWVETHGRTPTADEQAAIATSQHSAIQDAVATLTSDPQASEDAIGLVFADTSALQTAAYSAHYFSDHRLGATTVTTYPPGVRCIRLLMGLDLPWTPALSGDLRQGPRPYASCVDRHRQWVGTRELAESTTHCPKANGLGVSRLQRPRL